MTFEDTGPSGQFQVATPKGAKPAKTTTKPKPQPTEPVETVAATPAPIKRRRRGPNKVKAVDPYDDLRQIISLMKGLPGARRKIALNMLSIMFD